MGQALDVVPEAVLFRGVRDGKRVKRSLLVKNTTQHALDVLVTQPLSGVFELVLPESELGGGEGEEEEPRFFNTLAIKPNETLKMAVIFCPDSETLSEHSNLQDVVVLNAAGSSLQVPIKASKDAEVPTATLRRGGADEFWPATEDLELWVSGLLEDLKMVPVGNGFPAEPGLPMSEEPSFADQAAVGWSTGQEEQEEEEDEEEEELLLELEAGAPAQGVKDLKAYETLRERRRAEARAVEATLPPMGLTQRQPLDEALAREEAGGAGPKAVLQPTVVVMGRTAFSTTKHASTNRPPSSSGSQRPASPAPDHPPKEVLYIIDSGLIDARGQTVDLSKMPPEEVRRRYDLVQCRNDPTGSDHHGQGGSPPRLKTAPDHRAPLGRGAATPRDLARPPTEGSSTLGQLYGGNPGLSVSGAAGVNPVALAEAAAELGMSLADLPPPSGAMAGGLSQPHAPLQMFGNRPPSPSARLPPLERPPSSSGRSPPRTSVSFKQDQTQETPLARPPAAPAKNKVPWAPPGSSIRASGRATQGKAGGKQQASGSSKPRGVSKEDLARMDANWDML